MVLRSVARRRGAHPALHAGRGLGHVWAQSAAEAPREHRHPVSSQRCTPAVIIKQGSKIMKTCQRDTRLRVAEGSTGPFGTTRRSKHKFATARCHKEGSGPTTKTGHLLTTSCERTNPLPRPRVGSIRPSWRAREVVRQQGAARVSPAAALGSPAAALGSDTMP